MAIVIKYCRLFLEHSEDNGDNNLLKGRHRNPWLIKMCKQLQVL